ncbi:MAG: nucleotide pyrophosphatase [Planctomycetota bacterium]|nr:MAG: nucleotide pyrophosphatase [Planctomycetota bacterium]
MRQIRIVLTVALWVLLASPRAEAYIGPGAGFAFAGSALILVTTMFLALGTLLLFPLRMAWRLIMIGNPFKRARVKRVVILGLDGMDPGITTKLMREGRLPNLARLADQGVFRPLGTSYPSMSPVAWSSFTTGVDPSRHNIYDFLTRDPCTYMPMLSSTDIRQVERVLNIGKFMLPLPGKKASITLLQKSQAFWKLLGEKHIPAIIQRVPITFPPVPFKGLLLSGMCVPDLRGSQGTFGFFSTQSADGHAAFTGGEQTVLRRQGDRIRTRVVGPDDGSGGRMTLPMTITIAADKSSATLEIDGCDPFTLTLESYSEWITLEFKAKGVGKAAGIARFYITSMDPEFSLYHTPIHIDPENPAMPISHPSVYAIYLAKKLGKFATLGLAEDTWALNERVIDEKAFFDQAMLIADERVAMFKDALARTRKGLVTCVFDTTDRVQHMFYRYLDPDHPANEGRDTEQWKDAIPQVYQRMDTMIGDMWDELVRDDTCFMVISDHGFTNFRRGVNLNAWLRDNGYLFLKDDSGRSGDWFANVDWSRTRAFSLGLTGMFINRKGREASGIVEEGDEYESLVRELIAKLKQLRDPKDDRAAILDVFAATDFFTGPYRFDAPDLIIGYDGGFRNSWDCATGAVPEHVFSDNTKSWSGDHCVDPRIVPGVFFSNMKLKTETPNLMDMAPSVLALFGQEAPKYMQGSDVFAADGAADAVSGPLDPLSLSQSGSAPGALIFPDGRPDAAPRSAPSPVAAGSDDTAARAGNE